MRKIVFAFAFTNMVTLWTVASADNTRVITQSESGSNMALRTEGDRTKRSKDLRCARIRVWQGQQHPDYKNMRPMQPVY